MSISDLFIKRPVMTSLCMLCMLFFGVLAYFKLPVSDLPNVDYPVITVSVVYPGASPETMANTVASPLEKQFTTVPGIRGISSTSSNSSTSITLQFDLDTSMGQAAQDVQAKINQTSHQLPQDLPFAPTYSRVNPSDTPINYLVLSSSSMLPSELYQYGSIDIGSQLSTIEGVAQVSTYGSAFAVRIQVDPAKLKASNLDINDVAASISSQNINLSTGSLYGPNTEYLIEVDGTLQTAAKYNQIILKRSEDGAIIRLSDIGTAINSVDNERFSFNFVKENSSHPCVVLAIQKQPGANTIAVSALVQAKMEQLKKSLPKSIEVHNVFDKSEMIKEAVADVKLTLVVAILLVILVILFYLGKPLNTIIPALAIPLSIFGTFSLLSIFGFSIDILSLLAITLSIGFLVDDAIVVLENVVRHVESGKPPMQAALDGSKQIASTIISMTLCLAAVFIPMLFMDGVIGKIFHEFAATIIIAVLFSGFISLSLTPMLCSRLIGKESEKQSFLESLSLKINHYLLTHYKRGLQFSLLHKKKVLFCGFFSLILTATLFTIIPKDFLPADDLGFIHSFSKAPDSTSPYKMMKNQEALAKAVQTTPGVESAVSLGSIPRDNNGLMFIKLKPAKERLSLPALLGQLYAKTSQVIGVQTFFKPTPLIELHTGGGDNHSAYQYTLQSLSQNKLFTGAKLLEERLKKEPGFAQVSSDLEIAKPQLNLTIQREKAGFYNISAQEIEQTLGYLFSSAILSTIQLPESQYHVILEALPQTYNTPAALSQISIRSKVSQKLVPLSELVTITESISPASINHLGSLPAVTLSFNLENIPLGTAIEKLEQISQELFGKQGDITGSLQGAAQVFAKTFNNLKVLFIITLFVIYVILGILYENLFDPLTVMSTLPPAALGALATLLLFHMPLSLYSFVGIIMLLGIVLKNGIIMIEFANEELLTKNCTPEQAIFDASISRFRPILMTTIAAMMGAVPIAIGIGGATAEGRRPLGLAIIGGLAISQLITLFLTPVIYIFVEHLRLKLHRKTV